MCLGREGGGAACPELKLPVSTFYKRVKRANKFVCHFVTVEMYFCHHKNLKQAASQSYYNMRCSKSANNYCIINVPFHNFGRGEVASPRQTHRVDNCRFKL